MILPSASLPINATKQIDGRENIDEDVGKSREEAEIIVYSGATNDLEQNNDNFVELYESMKSLIGHQKQTDTGTSSAHCQIVWPGTQTQ